MLRHPTQSVVGHLLSRQLLNVCPGKKDEGLSNRYYHCFKPRRSGALFSETLRTRTMYFVRAAATVLVGQKQLEC